MEAYGKDRRWQWLRSQYPSRQPMEFVLCAAIITTILALVLQLMGASFAHLRQLNALDMSLTPKLQQMEYRAVYGEWPAPADGRTLRGLGDANFEVQLREGAADFIFSRREPALAGQVLSMRAWQAFGRMDLPVVWTCGLSQATPLIAAAMDRTTLRADEVVSPCRPPAVTYARP